MRKPVVNVHQRELSLTPGEGGALIDRLASEGDVLWPIHRWPPMRFDEPLAVGAKGGHGPIRYSISAYEPGRYIEFRFRRPHGFNGIHKFELEEIKPGRILLRHVIDMQLEGAWLKWHLVIRPLHDALLEDALDRATEFSGGVPNRRRWSLWVRVLRRVLRRKRPTRR